ncbi:MAG TPA: ATP-dependent zinc metalloprotease FtsH [Verrucomicrobiae bacterium]|nr:ATP-dependent zinc metalloprotease FtsH [Verrucomicrobiae bacterium]
MSLPKENGVKRPLPSGDGRKPDHWPPQQWLPMVWYLIMMLGMLWFWQEASHQLVTHTIPYSQFKDLVAQHKVSEATIEETDILGKVAPKSAAHSEASTNAAAAENGKTDASPGTYMFRTVRVEDPDLVADLQKSGVEFSGVRPTFISQFLWAWLVPIGVMILIWRFLARRMGNIGQGLMSFGSSKAKVVADTDTGITFNDVAGCDEAKYELQEVVTFLKNPDRYKALGAAIPKGILLIGPPGTGKTLLARAVAGEAKVPFFLISGSDFVEMFVGVGAARVRDLFEKAKVQAPCIVFIDELDAVARQRGVHMGPVNDEREQTLNQLLVGMDGFETNVGVIILAATNRPEVLDRALLRPGRFDRQVIVDAPDLEGRLAVLKIHVRNKPLETEVDLRKIAQQTPGFSGADLANLVNEAALLAARHNAVQISQLDLENAVDKVVAGPERKSRRLGDEEKRRVAYHEVGHALVAAYSKYADPVHKITIIPHGHAALGFTMQLPTEDRYLMSRSALLDKLKGQLGGRAAEEVVLGEISTGAENDLEHATALARQMVAMYGMSEVVGLAHCAQRQGAYLTGPPEGVWQRDCSEQTAREIDEEVKKILNKCYAEAKAILTEHRGELELIARELLKRETLDEKSFHRLLEQKAVPASNGA